MQSINSNAKCLSKDLFEEKIGICIDITTEIIML